MLFTNPRKLLSEAATADLLNPEVSDEVKEVINDLEDTLTNNVEEVKDSDKTTNGGIPVTTEAVSLMEAANGGSYGSARYLISLESVIAVKEAEGEAAAAEKMEEPGQAPSADECEECEPDAANVVEDIANKNGVDPEQVAVVITAENVRFLAQTALLESKCGKKGNDAQGTKKLGKMRKAVDELKDKVKLVKA